MGPLRLVARRRRLTFAFMRTLKHLLVRPGRVRVWINGYWGWGNGRYTWQPHQWNRVGNRWHLAQGYWRRNR